MNAMILAAGLGTRLRPLTERIPKCLVNIGGKPLLQIWLEKLSKLKIESILINTHYLHTKVDDFLLKYDSNKKIYTVYEKKLLGTGGSFIRNASFFGKDDGLLIYGDNYSLENLNNLIDAHKRRPNKCCITMMTFRTNSPASCGIVELDDEGIVIGFHEKVSSPPGNLANSAIYVFDNLFKIEVLTKYKDAFDFSRDILVKFMGRIYTYETKELYADIGTIESYLFINNKVSN